MIEQLFAPHSHRVTLTRQMCSPIHESLIVEWQVESDRQPAIFESHIDTVPAATHWADRAFSPMQVIGRLAPGVSLAQARAEFATISARLQVALPESTRNRSVGLAPYSMTSGGDSLIATQGPRFLAILSIVAALTLTIVCANVPGASRLNRRINGRLRSDHSKPSPEGSLPSEAIFRARPGLRPMSRPRG